MCRYTLVVAVIVLMSVLEWTDGVALGGTCTDTEDCTDDDPNSDCTGLISQTCTCDAGYTKEGKECKANLGTTCTESTDCDKTTVCTGVYGSKTCTCAYGYTNEGTACKANLGTACISSTDCDKKTICTGTTGSKICTCALSYTRQGYSCKANLGTGCTTTADCDTITNPQSICTGILINTCECASNYTKQGSVCKANLGTVCTATADCDTITTADAVCDLNAARTICAVGAYGECSRGKKCVTSACCVDDACSCSTGYAATFSNLCSNSGVVNAISLLVMLTCLIMVKIF